MGTQKKLLKPIEIDYLEVWAYLMGVYLAWEIGDKEFRIKFQKEIEAWFKYKDNKRFERYIDKVIKEEMSKFCITKDDIDKIIKEVFPEPEYIIIYPK